jgi:nucleoid DNA-binding protein
MSRHSQIKRIDFINRFHAFGLTYQQAEIAYSAMIRSFEDGIRDKSKIHLAKVGVLKPVDRPPREVVMGFERAGGVCQKKIRRFIIGSRTEFRFKVHRAFGRRVGILP